MPKNKKSPRMGAYGESEQRGCSDQRVDCVVDVAVGFSRCITRKAMVGFDVLQSFNVPSG